MQTLLANSEEYAARFHAARMKCLRRRDETVMLRALTPVLELDHKCSQALENNEWMVYFKMGF